MIDKIINTFKSQNKYFWFIAVRMFSFLIIGFETFFGPKIIGLENFAVVEYEKQLINLSAILLFGLHTGYGISYFKSNKKNKSTSFLLSGLFYILILFGIYSVISQTFSFGIIVFLLSIMMEQLLKIKNKFNLAILFKPLFSILLVTYYSYYYFFSENLMDFAFDVNLIYLMAFILFVVFTYKYLNLDYKEIHLNLKEFKEYLKNGFQPNLSTSLIITIFFLDRFLIEKYYESSLGVYSIAYNFSLISFLIASSLAYITSIKIGEKLKEPEQLKKMINRLMKVSYVYILVVG